MVTVNPNSLSGSHTVVQSNRKITLLVSHCPPSHFQLFSRRLPVTDLTGSPSWDLSAAGIQGGEPLFHPQRLQGSYFRRGSWHLYTCLPREHEARPEAVQGTSSGGQQGAAWVLHRQHCCSLFSGRPNSYNEQWQPLRMDKCLVFMTHMR